MFRTCIVSLISILPTAPSLWAGSPIGEVICAPRAEMVHKLSHQFGERMSGMGIRSPESMMEIWQSDSSGNWTLVMNYADGKSCIVAMGEGWEMLPGDPPA